MELTTLTAAGGDVLTNSRLACLRTCPRKHYYRYELGVVPDRDSQPLRFGAAFHTGLDHRNKGATADKAIAAAVAGYAEIPAWCTSTEQIEDWMVEAETVARMLSGYFWRWAADWDADSGQRVEVLASELPFDLPIVNPDTGRASTSFTIAGKIDRIVRLPDGRVAVWETKTAGEQLDAESDYWKRLRLDQQISTYYVAARRLGFDVQTVIYDVARKPSISPRLVKKSEAGQEYYGEPLVAVAGAVETPRMFGARLSADMAARPEFYFARREIPRLQNDLDEFEQELWDQQKTLAAMRLHNRFYRNTTACRFPYKCEYLDVCSFGADLAKGPPAGFRQLDNIHPELADTE